MLSRLRTIFLAIVLMAAPLGMAGAAELTANDYRYLGGEYGLTSDSDLVAHMTPAERQRLHGIIETFRLDPAGRDEAVRGELYDDYERQCDAWALDHQGKHCAPVNGETVEAGREVAEGNCNLCHRFGRSMSPSFFQLAKRRRWDADSVRLALSHTHNMVPVRLPETEYGDLAAYINSFGRNK